MNRILCTLLFITASAGLCAAQDYHKVEFFGGYSLARIETDVSRLDVSEGGSTFSFQPCTPDGAAALGSNFQQFYCARRTANGFDASITYNVRRRFGLVADVTGHFKTSTFADRFTGPGFDHTDTNTTHEHIFNFLGGVQFKDNATTRRVKPFAHALAGLAHVTARDVQTTSGTGGIAFTLNDSANSLALKLGGGVDVRVSPRVDVRLFEFDYNPIFGRARDVPGNADFTLRVAGRRADNFTLSFGVVIH